MLENLCQLGNMFVPDMMKQTPQQYLDSVRVLQRRSANLLLEILAEDSYLQFCATHAYINQRASQLQQRLEIGGPKFPKSWISTYRLDKDAKDLSWKLQNLSDEYRQRVQENEGELWSDSESSTGSMRKTIRKRNPVGSFTLAQMDTKPEPYPSMNEDLLSRMTAGNTAFERPPSIVTSVNHSTADVEIEPMEEFPSPLPMFNRKSAVRFEDESKDSDSDVVFNRQTMPSRKTPPFRAPAINPRGKDRVSSANSVLSNDPAICFATQSKRTAPETGCKTVEELKTLRKLRKRPSPLVEPDENIDDINFALNFRARDIEAEFSRLEQEEEASSALITELLAEDLRTIVPPVPFPSSRHMHAARGFTALASDSALSLSESTRSVINAESDSPSRPSSSSHNAVPDEQLDKLNRDLEKYYLSMKDPHYVVRPGSVEWAHMASIEVETAAHYAKLHRMQTNAFYEAHPAGSHEIEYSPNYHTPTRSLSTAACRPTITREVPFQGSRRSVSVSRRSKRNDPRSRYDSRTSRSPLPHHRRTESESSYSGSRLWTPPAFQGTPLTEVDCSFIS